MVIPGIAFDWRNNFSSSACGLRGNMSTIRTIYHDEPADDPHPVFSEHLKHSMVSNII